MTPFAKLMTATTLAASLALPLGATTLNTDASAGGSVAVDLGDSLNAGIDLGASASTTAETGSVASGSDAAIAATAEGAGAAAAVVDADQAAKAAAEAKGHAVMTAEGTTFGTIETAETNADGNVRLIIDVADDIKTDVKSFSLVVSADVAAKGDLKLSWTEAELVSSLDAKAKAKAEATNG